MLIKRRYTLFWYICAFVKEATKGALYHTFGISRSEMEITMKREDMLLYAITDRHWLKENEKLVDKVKEALEGGATFVQLREKNIDRETLIFEAREIRALCSQYRVPFVIDDDVEIARLVNADGVHVGQNDMSVKEARSILGAEKIIGVTAKTVEQARLAEEAGADYLGSGAMFATASKSDAIPMSKEMLRSITEAVNIPVVAIGGINYENVDEIAGCGNAGIAVIGAIFGQPDITEATKKLKEKCVTLF